MTEKELSKMSKKDLVKMVIQLEKDLNFLKFEAALNQDKLDKANEIAGTYFIALGEMRETISKVIQQAQEISIRY